MAEKKLYTYVGAVKNFNTVVANNWKGKTYAVSAKQAKCNLAYRYKQEHGLVSATRIELCGLPTEVA